jgi:DNA-binding SARP family transcriptional activator/tetratricopeptide (TPR) repeat protein
VQVRLLGPVDVVAHDGLRPVRGLRRRAVLATLALNVGSVVSTDRLLEVVWGDTAPPTAINTLQSHISHLRNVLGSKGAIVARPPGYLLDLGDDGTDVQRAERLLRQGTESADPAEGARHLREALALWRGRPLADLAGSVWLEEQARRLDALLVQVRRALVEARLAAGEHAQLVPELKSMVADHPLDEQLHAALMVALYRSGQQADALAAFHRLRRTLDEELGIDPSHALRDLETAILRQEPTLAVPAAAVSLPPPAAQTAPVPAQLPSALPVFAGRDAELARLDEILPGSAKAGDVLPSTVVISAVSGTAGVGKTALAVQWAHRVAGAFPDGQLYVNMRGFDPGGQAADPAEAVHGFLEALGVPTARIPAGLDARAALYRSLLAGKRVLVLLDNARDTEQIQPLLPGSAGCLAIVTSRSQLAGLVATYGAYPLSLDLLTGADARDLLARRLGAARVAGEQEAVNEIIERCTRLPLALTIAAARAAANPTFPLAVFASELREATSTLDPFDGGDPSTDARAVFSWSYRALSDDAARLFRLLGMHSGPDAGATAAASLAAVTPRRARALLAELTRAHLLSEHAPGRYAFHDLLRAYAVEQALMVDPDQDRNAAIRRMLDHYLHTGHRAATVVAPYFDPLPLSPAQPGVIVDELATTEDALGWFATEHAPLLAAVHRAAAAGFSTHAWQLVWALGGHLLRRGLWDELEAACKAGLDAARHTGDAAGQARCLHHLANGYSKAGRFHESGPVFQQALQHYESIGDLANQATIHGNLMWVAARQQRPADALSHALRAQEMFRAAGNRAGQMMVLSDVGYCYAMLGDYQQALACCEQALAEIQEAGERDWETPVWDTLGYTYHRLGEHQQAINCYQRAIDLSRERTDRYNEAAGLDTLGDVHHSAGDTGAARRAWTQALHILDLIGHPDSDLVRAKLHSHGGPASQTPAPSVNGHLAALQ